MGKRMDDYKKNKSFKFVNNAKVSKKRLLPDDVVIVMPIAI